MDLKNIEFENRVYDVPVDLIDSDEDWNCRGRITAQECISLAKDIQQNGQQQPGQLRVYDEKTAEERGKPFGLVSGFRRFYAVSRINVQDTYRAIFKENIDNDHAKAINFAENRERQNLNLLQEAKVFEYYLKKGYTEQEIMAICNVSRGYLQPRLMLLKMDDEIKDLAAAGVLNCSNIRDLNSYTNKEEQLAAARDLKNKKASGIKAVIAKPKKSKVAKSILKMKRSPKQIKYFLEHLFENQIPSGFHSRCLAWAAGEISDRDLYEDIEDYGVDPTNSFDFQEYIKELDPELAEPEEVGEWIINFLKDWRPSIYERPENGFPERNY